MVQLRALLVLGGIFLVTAQTDADSQSCAIPAAEAVDEMFDASIFIWASSKRCEQEGEAVRCEVNIASAVEATNGMINVILKALEQCGQIKSERAKCGMAIGVLTKSVAGLAAASGGITAQCKTPLSPQALGTVRGALDDASQYGHSEFGACIVDIKGAMKSLFQAIKRTMTVSENCKEGTHACVHNSIKIVSALASLGQFLASAVDHCQTGGNDDAACAAESLGLVHQLHNVARAGVAIDKNCQISAAERLYLEDDEEGAIAPATGSSSLTFALVTLLPITAVLSFVGGSRIARARATATPREFESLVASEE